MPDKRRNDNGLTFSQWMKVVNGEVSRLLGRSVDDLPDWDFWNGWDSCQSPGAHARNRMYPQIDLLRPPRIEADRDERGFATREPDRQRLSRLAGERRANPRVAHHA
jgi:hypothetical protein